MNHVHELIALSDSNYCYRSSRTLRSGHTSPERVYNRVNQCVWRPTEWLCCRKGRRRIPARGMMTCHSQTTNNIATGDRPRYAHHRTLSYCVFAVDGAVDPFPLISMKILSDVLARCASQNVNDLNPSRSRNLTSHCLHCPKNRMSSSQNRTPSLLKSVSLVSLFSSPHLSQPHVLSPLPRGSCLLYHFSS